MHVAISQIEKGVVSYMSINLLLIVDNFLVQGQFKYQCKFTRVSVLKVHNPCVSQSVDDLRKYLTGKDFCSIRLLQNYAIYI